MPLITFNAYDTNLRCEYNVANPGMDWSYWTVNRGVDCSFRPIGDGTYEVIVIVSHAVLLRIS